MNGVVSFKWLIASAALAIIAACGSTSSGPIRSPLDIPLTDVLSGATFTLSSAPGKVTIVEGMSVF